MAENRDPGLGGSVVHLADVKNDNRLITPQQALRQLADEIDRGEAAADGLVVLILDRSHDAEQGVDNFSVDYRISNLKSSEQVAMAEAFKKIVLEGMGY